MAEKTISDFIAKDNKGVPFEERVKKFEVRLKPLCEELGIIPWAGIRSTEEAILAVPLYKDLWESSKES